MPWTPLHIAIADEADVKVHEWAQDGTIMQWLNETDDAGVTPLHLASETSQTEIVQLLLSLGCVPSPRTTFNLATPMHLAAEEGCVPVVSILATAGADVNAAALEGLTPLHEAARYGHISVCEALVQHGATVNVEDDDKRTPLFYAVQQGHVETVARLMQLGADRDYRDRDGLTPVDCSNQNVTMEKALGSWKPRLVNELMQGFVQRVGSRICKETGFKDMPPHRIVQEQRFKKIFTRSDFLVYIERAKFQDVQFKEVTVKDVDDAAGPLFANAKEYALRVLEEQLAALTAKDEDGEMT